MSLNKYPWWSGLIYGEGGSVSIGRLSFWAVFGLTIYFWLCRPPELFPPTLDSTFGIVVAYNFGSKAVNNLTHKGVKKDG